MTVQKQEIIFMNMKEYKKFIELEAELKTIYNNLEDKDLRKVVQNLVNTIDTFIDYVETV